MFKSTNFLLFIIPAIIWGSTWFVITFQLGEVDPLVSVSYRFLIGGVILWIYAWLRKLPLSFTSKIPSNVLLAVSTSSSVSL